jgi:hypothetical protein
LVGLAGVMSATAFAQHRPLDDSGTVRRLHDTMIKPASDVVFSVGHGAPKTVGEWSAISRAGATLGSAGHLMLASRTDVQVKWTRLSRELAAAGRSARRAADARSVSALMRASDRLIVVCETCHAAYRK